jgi:hypothetical protein
MSTPTPPLQKPYGCHNRRPFPPEIAARFKDTCHYTLTDLGQADTRCLGCKHRKEKPEMPDVATPPTLAFTVREKATVLAALREWQRDKVLDPDRYKTADHSALATVDGRFKALTSTEIDALIERIN